MEHLRSKVEAKLNKVLEKSLLSGSFFIAKEKEILFNRSQGMANYELNVANSPATKFRIGSLTKLFTAVAIMQLKEKGQLDLDATIDLYIADYPNGNEIKISHLLNHTSGIMNLTELPDFPEWVKTNSPVSKTIDRFKYLPLDFPPGKDYKYSNSGYVLLSYILELISGDTYEQYLNKNIFKPLNINNTAVDKQEEIIAHRASGYNYKNNTIINAPFIHMNNPLGAASLYSTTEDLYRFNQAFFINNLLSPASRRMMLQSSIGDHGFGWMIKNDKNQKVAFHGGSINGFSAHFLRYTESNLTFIMLCNVMYSKQRIESLADQFVNIIFSEVDVN